MIGTPSNSVFSFAEACDRGKKREENQDQVRHVSTPLGELVIVADGIGGYRGGAVAARMVVDSFETWFAGLQPGTSPAQAIAEAAAHANANIYEAAASGDPVNARMGSTVVMALITPEGDGAQAWLGHVGDSRAYLCRDGRLSRLTRDHSAVQSLIDKGALLEEEAATHPDRSVLLRSVGHAEHCEIEMSVAALQPGDTLLLCTDGLWGFVPQPSIEMVLADSALDVTAAANALLGLALDAGGLDNIGIELVRVHAAVKAPERNDAGELSSEVEPKRGSAGSKFLYAFLAIAIIAALGWYAMRNGWLPQVQQLLQRLHR